MWYLKLNWTEDFNEERKAFLALGEASDKFLSEFGRRPLPKNVSGLCFEGWDARDPRSSYRYLKVKDREFAKFMASHTDEYYPLRLRETWQVIPFTKEKEPSKNFELERD
jgi:hypothetical protein